jgi:hypothetical protein
MANLSRHNGLGLGETEDGCNLIKRRVMVMAYTEANTDAMRMTQAVAESIFQSP